MNDSNPSEHAARLACFDQAVEDSPELKEAVSDITQMLQQGHVTLAQVGGFAEHELEGGYQAAMAKLEGGQPAKAIKILGVLITLNPKCAKYYRLVGVALHRLQKYELAERYYGLAGSIDPDDPICQLYRGEVLLLKDNRVLGRKYLKKGIELAGTQPGVGPIVQRARGIAEAFGVSVA